MEGEKRICPPVTLFIIKETDIRKHGLQREGKQKDECWENRRSLKRFPRNFELHSDESDSQVNRS